MYTFKQFLTEQAWPDYKAGSSIKDYADKVTPRVAGGFAGGATTGRLAAALRFGNKVIAGPPGEPHSGLASYADKLGKPDAMGFVRKEPGDISTGEHGGAFFSRQQATAIGNKHPDIKNDPTPENPKYPSQSYDFKPESGKGGKKKIKEEVYSFEDFDPSKFRKSGNVIDKRSYVYPGYMNPGGAKGQMSAPNVLSSDGRKGLSGTQSGFADTDSSSAGIGAWARENNPYASHVKPGEGLPESGKSKKKKKVKEEVYSFKEFLIISEEKDAAKKKKPAAKKKNVSKFGIANKEAVHGGMSYYSSSELS